MLTARETKFNRYRMILRLLRMWQSCADKKKHTLLQYTYSILPRDKTVVFSRWRLRETGDTPLEKKSTEARSQNKKEKKKKTLLDSRRTVSLDCESDCALICASATIEPLLVARWKSPAYLFRLLRPRTSVPLLLAYLLHELHVVGFYVSVFQPQVTSVVFRVFRSTKFYWKKKKKKKLDFSLE